MSDQHHLCMRQNDSCFRTHGWLLKVCGLQMLSLLIHHMNQVMIDVLLIQIEMRIGCYDM